MIVRTFIIAFSLFAAASVSVLGQITDKQKVALNLLSEKKAAFQNASPQDTAFVLANSDRKYYLVRFERGDQEADIDKEVFDAKVGDAVGPFPGDTLCYLFKVIDFDSMVTARATIYNIIPNVNSRIDTAKLRVQSAKYLDAIRLGKDISKMALKDEKTLFVRTKDLGYFYETKPEKEHYERVFNMEYGQPVLFKTTNGFAIIDVTEGKKKRPYKVHLLPLVKKI